MSELDTLTMERVREMSDHNLRMLVAELRGWTDIIEDYDQWNYTGTPPDGGPSGFLPGWPWLLDDAAKLVQGTIFHAFTLSGLYDFGWSATIRDHKDVKYVEHARQPARAVTLAWVAWRLRQGR